MRSLVLGSALLLCACNSFPVMAEPRLLVSPYYATYRLRGEMSMQSAGPVDNRSQSLRNFGFGDYESDIGARADLGDGFAGLRLDYYRLSMDTTATGILDDDFGTLLPGDSATMSARMDEWRLGWFMPVWRDEVTVRDAQVDLRLALGGVYAHREIDIYTRSADFLRQQNLGIDGDLVYPGLRFRAGVQAVAFDLEYAICPNLSVGDFEDVQQDFEARLSYMVPYQDVTMFAAFRYSTLNAEGDQGGLGFDTELVLDGFQFGVQVTF